MPQFDAEHIAEPLLCKLKPYAEFEQAIPEPSDRQIGVFLHGLKDLFTRARESAGLAGKEIEAGNADSLTAAFESLDPDEFVKFMEIMAELHAALCSGKPSKTQILRVPMRRRLLFFAWLEQEVVNPEAAPGAGSAQVRTLQLPAAG